MAGPVFVPTKLVLVTPGCLRVSACMLVICTAVRETRRPVKVRAELHGPVFVYAIAALDPPEGLLTRHWLETGARLLEI